MTGGRTTWRTSWPAAAGTAALLVAVFLSVQALLGERPEVGPTVSVLVAVAAVTVVVTRLFKVTATPQGLEVWRFGSELVPWSAIDEVGVTGARWNSQVVRVVVGGRARRLRAPTSFLGLGTSTVDEAATEIERWRHTYRDVPPHLVRPVDETALWAAPPE